MTMRTYRFFECPNGHKGEEKTSENDQPYSTVWENVSIKGLKEMGTDSYGHRKYVCTVCGAPTAEVLGHSGRKTPEPPASDAIERAILAVFKEQNSSCINHHQLYALRERFQPCDIDAAIHSMVRKGWVELVGNGALLKLLLAGVKAL